MMNGDFFKGKPGPEFWQEYTVLWQNSLDHSPFQAPHFIEFLTQDYAKKVVYFACRKEGKLVGTAFFRKFKGCYIFLSEVKSDHNTLVLHRDCTSEDLEEIFRQLLSAIKHNNWAFVLNNFPNWASYMPMINELGLQSTLFWDNHPYSVCPTLKETSGQAIYDRFNGSRELRYRVNRLKKQQEAEFEVFQKDEDLLEWVDQFCQLHIKRWKGTSSPSRYEQEAQRAFLLHCLQAWIEDEVLVRFSIKIADGTRIGFVVGLLEGDSLIHHTTAYDDQYRKYSPGKALIHFIGQWMAQQNLSNLDFGQGDEKYKYEFTNTEPKLNRIFVSPPLHFPFILKAKIAQSLRSNDRLRRFYREKIKPVTKK